MALSTLPDGTASRAEVWIKLMIAGGHYVYGHVDEQDPFQPLAVELRLPDGAEFDGDWSYPESRQLNGHAVYYDSVLVHRRGRPGCETCGVRSEASG